MLKAVEISNFKSIKHVRIEELGKINVFFGPNNSGKSSILQAIALLAQSSGRQPIYDGNFVKLSKFENVVFGKDPRNNIEISVKFKLSEEEVREINELIKGSPYEKSDLTQVEYFVRMKDYPDLQSIKSNDELELCRVFFSKGTGVIKYRYIEKEYSLSSGSYSNIVGAGTREIGWRAPSSSETPYASNVINRLCEIIGERLSKIYFISTMRGVTSRSESVSSPPYFGPHGENAPALMHWIYSNKREVFFDKILKWAREFDVSDMLSPLVGSDTYLAFKDSKLGVEVNAVDSGFGLSQLIPIIGQCFLAEPYSVIMVEEPEIHLHKSSQYKLIDMFREVCEERKQILMTTHSDLMIARLWRLIRVEKAMKEEDVSLYRVDKTNNGSEVKKVDLDVEWNKLKNEYQDFLR
jgi:predicted ATPase